MFRMPSMSLCWIASTGDRQELFLGSSVQRFVFKVKLSPERIKRQILQVTWNNGARQFQFLPAIKQIYLVGGQNIFVILSSSDLVRLF